MISPVSSVHTHGALMVPGHKRCSLANDNHTTRTLHGPHGPHQAVTRCYIEPVDNVAIYRVLQNNWQTLAAYN